MKNPTIKKDWKKKFETLIGKFMMVVYAIILA